MISNFHNHRVFFIFSDFSFLHYENKQKTLHLFSAAVSFSFKFQISRSWASLLCWINSNQITNENFRPWVSFPPPLHLLFWISDLHVSAHIQFIIQGIETRFFQLNWGKIPYQISISNLFIILNFIGSVNWMQIDYGRRAQVCIHGHLTRFQQLVLLIVQILYSW
jgi:hypothetical protein